jgi:hypothetical protein
VTPAKGRVYGGVTLEGSGALTQVALRPLPVFLKRPVVVPVIR